MNLSGRCAVAPVTFVDAWGAAVRILVVEDDVRVAAALAAALRRRGHEVLCASSVEEARKAGGSDLILLDLGLPDGDGLDLCRTLRERDPYVPIIAVTARAEVRDRVLGLGVGADDYVVKPFSMAELYARIRSVLRRAALPPPAPDRMTVGRVSIDPAARRVRCDGRDVPLTRKEFDILAVLARQPGAAVRREQIALAVWRTSHIGGHTLEVHVASLRAKLGAADLVQTVRGIGYRLAAG